MSEDMNLRPPGKKQETLSKKITKTKRAGSMTQVVKCPSSKQEALSSPVLPKRKKQMTCILNSSRDLPFCLWGGMGSPGGWGLLSRVLIVTFIESLLHIRGYSSYLLSAED
jgi:hypothetical protein